MHHSISASSLYDFNVDVEKIQMLKKKKLETRNRWENKMVWHELDSVPFVFHLFLCCFCSASDIVNTFSNNSLILLRLKLENENALNNLPQKIKCKTCFNIISRSSYLLCTRMCLVKISRTKRYSATLFCKHNVRFRRLLNETTKWKYIIFPKNRTKPNKAMEILPSPNSGGKNDA